MTTSYKLEAVKALKAQKKEARAKEEAEAKAAAEAEEIKHQANLERIAKKMARIEAGLPVEEPEREKPKKAATKKQQQKLHLKKKLRQKKEEDQKNQNKWTKYRSLITSKKKLMHEKNRYKKLLCPVA